MRQERQKKRPLTEAEKQEIERSYADMFDREVGLGSPKLSFKQRKEDQKEADRPGAGLRFSKLISSFDPVLEKIRHVAGSAMTRVNRDHVIVGGGSLPFNARPPIFQGGL